MILTAMITSVAHHTQLQSKCQKRSYLIFPIVGCLTSVQFSHSITNN